MNKKIIMVICLISIFLFSACQATPESPVIISKNDGKLEEKIEENLTEDQFVVDDSISKWVETITTDNGIKIDMDADVIVPETTQFPVIRVKPRGFTDEEIKKAVNYLSNGADIYKNTTYEMTKERITEYILNAKKQVSELEKSTSVSAQNKVDYLNEQISMNQDYYASAPTEAELGKTEVSLNNLDSETDIMFQQETNGYATFTITDDREEFNKCAMRYQRSDLDLGYTNHHYQNTPAKGMNMTKEEALALADKTLAGMGIEGFQMVEVLVGNQYQYETENTDQQSYMFYYTRSINGIETPYAQIYAWKSTEIVGEMSDSYRPSWTPEYIMIQVDDMGVKMINWFNPVEIIEVENENVKVLNYQEIQELFSKNMDYIVSGMDTGNMTVNVSISKVILGFQFVPIKNNYDEYRMIPCWVFKGNDNAIADTTFANVPANQLILNAIDGSIL